MTFCVDRKSPKNHKREKGFRFPFSLLKPSSLKRRKGGGVRAPSLGFVSRGSWGNYPIAVAPISLARLGMAGKARHGILIAGGAERRSYGERWIPTPVCGMARNDEGGAPGRRPRCARPIFGPRSGLRKSGRCLAAGKNVPPARFNPARPHGGMRGVGDAAPYGGMRGVGDAAPYGGMRGVGDAAPYLTFLSNLATIATIA